ncbi:hypothetical protein HMPREF9348_05580, partial [Escherichia coli MS 145-7]
ATGYRSALPQILPSLMPLITMHDKNTFKVRDDFTLEWSGPKENNIFVVNASMQTHGIAEPQLSLMAWRSARILNRVMGRDFIRSQYAARPDSVAQRHLGKTQPEAASLTRYTASLG